MISTEPATKEDSKVEKQHPFFTAVGLPVAKGIAWLLFTLFGPTRVFGKYRVPKKGGLLILANHRSDVDPPLVQIACPRPIYFMAKSEILRMPFLGWILKFFRVFPVKRGEPDKSAIKKAVAYLRAGEAVCVFPEGELSETGEMLPLKPGVALIVRMAQAPVICVGLRGTAKMLPYGKLVPRPAFGWIEAHWGETHTFGAHESAETILGWADGQLKALTDERP